MDILKLRIRGILYNLSTRYHVRLYRLRHWLFHWGMDEGDDLVFSIAGVLHFTKYKEHTLVSFGRRVYAPAPKWIRGD